VTGVAVVMPVRDHLDYLLCAVQSVIDQSYRNWELIVVDDGSELPVAPVLMQHFNDPRILCYRTEKRGVTEALRFGIARTTAPLIARHDADDWSDPGRLEAQCRHMSAFPECAVVATGIQVIDADGAPLEVRQPPGPDRLLDSLRKGPGNPIAHGSTMFRLDSYLAVGGYRSAFVRSQDLDLWLRLSQEGDIMSLPGVYYHVRISPGSVGNLYHAEQKYYARLARSSFEDRRRPLTILVRLHRAMSRLARGRMDSYASYYLSKGISYIGAGNLKSAARAILLSLRLSPIAPISWYHCARLLAYWAKRKVSRPGKET
jgi:glycosyltransferase involved in cell wall biosynthesis